VRAEPVDDPLGDDPVLAAVLVGAEQALAKMVVDGGVGTAPGRAGEGHGGDARAGAAHQELRARANEGRLRRPGAEAEAGRELLAHRAEDRCRVVGGGGADDHLAGEHHLLHLARGDPRCRLLYRVFEGAGRAGAADLRTRGRVRVEQRQGRVGAQAGEPRPQLGRAPLGVVARSDHRVDGEEALRVAPGDRDLGQEQRAGLERAPARASPTLRIEGESTEPDRSGTGGQRARLVEDRVAAGLPRRPRDLDKAPRAARGRLPRHPHPGEGEIAVGLLPAEPAVARQSGSEDHRARVLDLHRGSDADQRPPTPRYASLERP
jgi:hypothetical protein